MVSSLGFGDLDRDGDLDGVFGRWTSGQKLEKPIPGYSTLPSSSNFLIWNEAGGIRLQEMDDIPGETLTTLISDLDQDGWADLIVGNDFDAPDSFYRGVGEGLLKQVNRSDRLFPQSTETTMSVISSDIDNDLELEIYLAQIAEFDRNGSFESSSKWMVEQPSDIVFRHFQLSNLLITARHRNSLAPLLEVEEERDRRILMALNLIDRYARSRWINNDLDAQRWMEQLLEEIPQDLRAMAGPLVEGRYVASVTQSEESIPQVPHRNALLDVDKENRYDERAEELGIEKADWAWNAKFADFNHDQFQDLLVVGGYLPTRIRETNHYFSNQRGERFQEETESVGLVDHLSTSASTFVDFDRDGDLDVITVPIDHEPLIYENHLNDGASVVFRLQDERGNRFGVGARIIVRYGPDGSLHQMREVLASGGFLSHDAPLVHFGLGDHEQIDRIEIHWPSGDSSTIEYTFRAGADYTIRRTSEP
ncbi:MAG: CRTAC1 family protein, partial [Verrucomicrobiota bacterium]